MIDKKLFFDTWGSYIEIGQNIYNLLQKENNTKFIICPANMGDTSVIASFVQKYKEINNAEVILVIMQQHKDVFELYPQLFTVKFSNEQMLALKTFIIYYDKYNENNIIYGHFPPTDNSLLDIEVNNELSFIDNYKLILGLPLDTKPDLGSFANIPEERKSEIEKLYENSVILFPFAKTYKELNVSFWDKLVKDLNSNEVSNIFTNSLDYVVSGTLKCDLKVTELCYAANIAKLCIGIRSGIFDIIACASPQSSNIVIYPELKYLSVQKGDWFFDLKNANPDLKVESLACSNKNEDELIAQIDNLIEKIK